MSIDEKFVCACVCKKEKEVYPLRIIYISVHGLVVARILACIWWN